MSKDNVRDILKKKAEQRETEAEGMVVEVHGDLPERAARVADVVLLTWGDPSLVNSPTIEIPFIVTLSDPATGRVNGQMVCDPTMQGRDPRTFQQIQMPPIVPVANVPYSATPRPITWRFREG